VSVNLDKVLLLGPICRLHSDQARSIRQGTAACGYLLCYLAYPFSPFITPYVFPLLLRMACKSRAMISGCSTAAKWPPCGLRVWMMTLPSVRICPFSLAHAGKKSQTISLREIIGRLPYMRATVTPSVAAQVFGSTVRSLGEMGYSKGNVGDVIE